MLHTHSIILCVFLCTARNGKYVLRMYYIYVYAFYVCFYPLGVCVWRENLDVFLNSKKNMLRVRVFFI
jgi:hypothetical protein